MAEPRGSAKSDLINKSSDCLNHFVNSELELNTVDPNFQTKVIFTTVKLGYNDHGYNEFIAISNKMCCIIWSQMVTSIYNPSRLQQCHGYNEQILTVP